MQKKYFYNLNGIRFILASMVLVHHVAAVTQLNGISSLYNKLDILKAFGPVAVSLFFALSGFLISYILLAEKKQTQTIALKKFYFSRALRILPLYYLIVCIHLFIFPHTPLHALECKMQIVNSASFAYTPTPLSDIFLNAFYLLLMPQVALALIVATGNTFVPAGHVWSIGVEEIFYLIWPYLLLKYSHQFKWLIKKLFYSYYGIGVFIFVLAQFSKNQSIQNHLLQRGINFSIILFLYNRVTCMFIGAIGAYILLYKPAILERLTSKRKFYFSLFFILFLFAIGARVPFLTHEVYCILFVIILLFLVKDDKQYFLESKVLNYLGKISYGIYMYQMIAIFFCTFLYQQYHFNYLLLYPFSFIITIILAAFSYKLFESWFLNYKSKL